MTEDTAILDLIGGLVQDDVRHGTGAASPPVVIPVVHDSFERDQPLLEAALRRFGGHLLVADPDQLVLPADPDSLLIDLVRAVCDRYPLDITITVENGEVEVGVAERGSGNDSHRVVLGTLAALLSYGMTEARMVALAYPAEGLDRVRLAFLWELLVVQVPASLPPALSTFVPILAGPVSIRDHCVGHPSARWVVRSLVAHRRRRDPDALDSQVHRLAGDLSRPLVLFLGAGASASSRIPQGDGIRDDAAERLLGGSVPHEVLPERFHTWCIEEGRLLPDEDHMDTPTFTRFLTLERVLHEEFRDLLAAGKTRAESPTVRALQKESDEALGRLPQGRQALRRILAAHPRVIVVEVNFDRQVEDGLVPEHAVYWRSDHFDDAADHVRRRVGGNPRGGVPILKIHGSIEDPDSLVADLAQTVSGLDPRVRNALEAILGNGPADWAWVGCSMRDRDINQWMSNHRDGRLVIDWWVDPLPGPNVQHFVDDARPPAVQVALTQRLITETADSFLDSLAGRIDELLAAP